MDEKIRAYLVICFVIATALLVIDESQTQTKKNKMIDAIHAKDATYIRQNQDFLKETRLKNLLIFTNEQYQSAMDIIHTTSQVTAFETQPQNYPKSVPNLTLPPTTR